MDEYQSIPQPQYPAGGSKFTSSVHSVGADGRNNGGNGVTFGRNGADGAPPSTFAKELNSEIKKSNGQATKTVTSTNAFPKVNHDLQR